MDTAFMQRLTKLNDFNKNPACVMPMSLLRLFNPPMATVPTLLDLVLQGEMENHLIEKGDIIVLVSVGPAVNINFIVYQRY